MLIYGVTFTVLYLVHLLLKNFKIRGKNGYLNNDKYYLLFSWIVISFLEGFRANNVGTDTNDYVRSFEQLDFKFDVYEPLSKAVVYAVRLISQNPTVYLTICALFINGLILITIYRMSVNCHYSIFIFISLLFYFTSFNALRQAFAYACVFSSFYYICEKKWVKYIVLIFIGVGFHSSAIIGLALILIPIIEKRKKKHTLSNDKYLSFKNLVIVIITISLALICWRMFDVLLVYAAQFFPKYEVYLFNEYRNMVGGIQQPIVYSAIFLCFMLIVPNKARYKHAFLIPLSFAVIIAFASLRMTYISRFMWYFDITTVLSIPYMLNNNSLNIRSKKILKGILTIICIAFLCYGLMNDYMSVSDYIFVWK